MKSEIVEERVFSGVNFSVEYLGVSSYENCQFENCSFNGVNLSHLGFLECKFVNCDLSSANLNNTSLKDIEFVNCKMLGLQFDSINPFLFQISCDECQLSFCSFYNLNLRSSRFTSCNFSEVDFSNSILNDCTFEYCDFKLSNFEQTNLEKLDLSNCINYQIDPNNNRIRGASFSRDGVEGLLIKYGIKIK